LITLRADWVGLEKIGYPPSMKLAEKEQRVTDPEPIDKPAR